MKQGINIYSSFVKAKLNSLKTLYFTNYLIALKIFTKKLFISFI